MKRLVLTFVIMFAASTFSILSNRVDASTCMNNYSHRGLIVTFRKSVSTRYHKRMPSRDLCEACFVGDNSLLFSFYATMEDAKIEITKDNIPVFSENYRKLESSLEIQLPELETGEYVIEITNNEGVNLYGEFEI